MIRFNIRNSCLHKLNFEIKCHSRNFSSKTSENLSVNIRQKFLDYFINQNNHKYVRSSPVVPFCDPTVAFVNAGMNQFKSIFLEQQNPTYKRVANSQKCIRVGGKHNDLNIVGTDGYHHTFFEMLGNWSFGDYFKKEACEMAWYLLTNIYGLKPSSLYVTYFGGDSKLNLEPDLECRDIWKTIGVADNHILPFGTAENFWEMGITGPCGPCTEIHIDHTGKMDRFNDVNKNIPDLTELWNLVFIQYNRNLDGSIELLPKHHIDTGMGLERLTAVLQGKNSNYDTDIFEELFKTIQKKCKGLPEYCGHFGTYDKKGIDTAYRILADHSRMITACLSDGMIPEENQKLRRILRKIMLLSETTFKQDSSLLNELVNVVAQNLGEVYPEMRENLNQVHQIICYEEDVYKSIRSTATKEWSKILEKEPKLKNFNILEMPGLVSAYNEIISSNTTLISPQLGFKLYDTYGLDENTIRSLSTALRIKFDENDLKNELNSARLRTRNSFLSNDKINKITNSLIQKDKTKTNDEFKYRYRFNGDRYEFDNTDCKVLYLIQEDKLVNELESNTHGYVILNQTNFYTESGGQASDKGYIEFSNGNIFEISQTQKLNEYILHEGILKSKGNLKVGDNGKIFLDEINRLENMRNHTATHLLNSAVKKVAKGVTYQKSSKVTPECLIFDVGIYSKKLSVDDIETVEKLIKNVIKKSTDVQIKEINSQELLSLDNVTILPGEVYPDVGIRLIEIENEYCSSRELCCGTHVFNTSHIKDICITNIKSLGRSSISLTAVTGDYAILAHKNGEKILQEVTDLEKNITDPLNETNSVDNITKLKQTLCSNERNIPVYVRSRCLKKLNNITKQLRDTERDSLKTFIDLEMSHAVESNLNKSNNNTPYIVHFLGCSSIMDNIPLQRATKICSNIPVIVISYSDEIVKARCCVPQNMINSEFNAELWLKNTVGKVCQSVSTAPKGQDSSLVCNMKPKHINKLKWESVLDESLKAAKNYAQNNL